MCGCCMADCPDVHAEFTQRLLGVSTVALGAVTVGVAHGGVRVQTFGVDLDRIRHHEPPIPGSRNKGRPSMVSALIRVEPITVGVRLTRAWMSSQRTCRRRSCPLRWRGTWPGSGSGGGWCGVPGRPVSSRRRWS